MNLVLVESKLVLSSVILSVISELAVELGSNVKLVTLLCVLASLDGEVNNVNMIEEATDVLEKVVSTLSVATMIVLALSELVNSDAEVMVSTDNSFETVVGWIVLDTVSIKKYELEVYSDVVEVEDCSVGDVLKDVNTPLIIGTFIEVCTLLLLSEVVCSSGGAVDCKTSD